MRTSGQYFLLTKMLEKWFPKSAVFHRCSVPSIDNRMRNSPNAIDTKSICDKMKHTLDRDFKMDLHICNKNEVVDTEKNSSCVSHKLLMHPRGQLL